MQRKYEYRPNLPQKNSPEARLGPTFAYYEYSVASHDAECVQYHVVNVEDAYTEENLHHFET